MSRRLLLTVCLLLLCSVTAWGQTFEVGEAIDASTVESVRRNFIDYYTGARGSMVDSRVGSAVLQLEQVALEVTSPGFLRSDGSWTDIDYAETPTGAWSPWSHFRRMTVMAKAYRTPGQSFYRSAVLRVQLESSLNFIQTFYGPSSPTPGNWWFWPIGAPLDLGPTLVLLQGEIDPAVMSAAVRTLRAHIGSYPYITPGGSFLSGQNLVWSSFTHLCLGLLENDTTMIGRARDAMASVCVRVRGKDGIQYDYSFHQHGPQLYTGAYGASFAYEAAKYALLTSGTDAQLPEEPARVVADYMIEGLSWSIRQNYFDVSSIGREVARPSSTGFNGIAALLQMSLVPSQRQPEIRQAASEMLRSWNSVLPIELAALTSDVERSSPEGSFPEGHRHFENSDYSVHRRSGYYLSIKMLSERTKSGERTNNENLLGSRQSDGRMNLVLTGDEYFGSRVWPAMDWTRLPGVTVEQRSDAASSTYGYGTRKFAGGTGDGRNGVSAMDYGASLSLLSARKAWIFFDDVVLFLNSATCPTPDRVETVVQQWPLQSIDSPLIVDGISKPVAAGWSETLRNIEWAVADGIGYYFPGRATIQARREIRSGSWGSLGGSPADQVVTHPFLTLWFDHGYNIRNAQAVYAIVPNRDAASMRRWIAETPVTILANDERVSAARDNRTGAIGYVFWQAGGLGDVQTDLPVVVYSLPKGRALTLSAADPTQGAGWFRIKLPGRWNLRGGDPRVVATASSRETTLTLPRNGGATVTVVLEKYQRLRGVRPSSN